MEFKPRIKLNHNIYVYHMSSFNTLPWDCCLKIFYFVHCREALADIFDRCDLDENGYLSRQEFNLFHMKSTGEECDDDAWEVMKGE